MLSRIPWRPEQGNASYFRGHLSAPPIADDFMRNMDKAVVAIVRNGVTIAVGFARFSHKGAPLLATLQMFAPRSEEGSNGQWFVQRRVLLCLTTSGS